MAFAEAAANLLRKNANLDFGLAAVSRALKWPFAGVAASISAHRSGSRVPRRRLHARYTGVSTSGHLMPIDCPDVVTSAIAAVLDLANHALAKSH